MTRLKGVAPCKIPGCPKLYYGRGWCQNHYARWYRSGDPLGSTLKDPYDRFHSFVEATDTCWFWRGAISDKGYGNFWINGQTVLAHRFAYQFMVGEVPEGLTLDHLCVEPSCIRPEHLEPVTLGENIRRQRHNSGRFGSRTPSSSRKEATSDA